MKAIIIEDEHNSRELLQNLLKIYCPEVEVISWADTVQGGYSAIKNQKPDLIFLDIKLSDGSGFDLLKMIDNITFQLICITAYQEFAVRAFQFSAVDYLLKPISPDLLIKAVDKASKQHERPKMEIETLIENYQNSRNKKLIVKTNTKIYAISLNEIARMEADSSYTTIFLKNGHKIMAAKQLKEYEELLSTDGFMRVHQSHLINLEHLFYVHKSQNTAVLNDDSSVPISIKKKSGLLTYLANLSK